MNNRFDSVKCNPFNVVQQFEETIANYAGSKYGVALDSCTNAIFLSLLYCDVAGKEVTVPSRTYPSVPCSVINAGGKIKFVDQKWVGTYRLEPFPIVDGAKRFTKGMYEKGMFHCISFHAKKHLPIGRGGMILTDDEDAYKWFKRSRFDGRRECALKDDDLDMIGWNFYMTPEQAARGLWLFICTPEYNDDLIEEPDYPDLSKCKAYQQ